MNSGIRLNNIFNNIDAIIHCAAIAHDLKFFSKNKKIIDNVNVQLTDKIIDKCIKFKIKKFIYISSAKVIGDVTTQSNQFNERTKENPQDLYSISKFRAENLLKIKCKKYNINLIIIRPPLIYGPGVKANFYNLMKYINKGYPLPFFGVKNKRSLISCDNLNSFIEKCINNNKIKNEKFVVSDGKDISIEDLVISLGNSLNKKAKLFYIPKFISSVLLQNINAIYYNKLFGSFELDISKAKNKLNWEPESNIQIFLNKTAKYFKEN